MEGGGGIGFAKATIYHDRHSYLPIYARINLARPTDNTGYERYLNSKQRT